jgi:hypothetical protein
MAGMVVDCPKCRKKLRLPGVPQGKSTVSPTYSATSQAVIWLSVFSVVALLLAVLFGMLWRCSSGKEPKVVEKPVEVIKEIPVDRVKEVPVERVKEVEVPAKLTDLQQADIELGSRYRNAVYQSDPRMVLRNMGPVSVNVSLADSVKEVVSEERIKNKLELFLRKNNIVIDDKSPHMLWFGVEGVWQVWGNTNEKITLSYSCTISLHEIIVFERQSGMNRIGADVWNKSCIGYAGKNVVEKAILDNLEEKAEAFANEYLAAQQ